MTSDDEILHARERIVIMIDPRTKETWIENHTRAKNIIMKGEVDAGKNDKDKYIVIIKAVFQLEEE